MVRRVFGAFAIVLGAAIAAWHFTTFVDPRPGAPPAPLWGYGDLAVAGVLLVAGGYLVKRRTPRNADRDRAA